MEFRRLGSTGLRVSLVGLGCNNFGERIDLDASRRVVHKALDLGITFFDTADTYGGKGGSETCLGEILGPRRHDVILASKFGSPMSADALPRNASRRYVMGAVEASLRRLRTDRIDLYQLHFPDPATPIEETLRALDDLVRHGKVHYIGCSNFSGWQVADADWTARSSDLHRFASCQNPYNILLSAQSQEWLAAMEAYGISLLPAYPLAGGLLTGKYRRGQPPPKNWRLGLSEQVNRRFATERNWNLIEALQGFCTRSGMSLHELALSWLAAQPFIASVIAGASNPEQLEQNFKAATRVLSADAKREVDEILAAS